MFLLRNKVLMISHDTDEQIDNVTLDEINSQN